MSLLSNLQAYYRFDESSGNAADASGNGYTLTNNGTVAFNTGLINNGADFGSPNTTKTFTNTVTAGISVDTPMSFAGWVNISASPSSGIVYDIFGTGYSGSNVFYVFEYGNFSGTIRFRVGRARAGVDDPSILYTTTLSTSVWYHIAYTIDSSRNQVFYLNGTDVGSNTAASGTGSFGLTTGTYVSRASFGGRLLPGKVDEWGMWSKVLTPAEVSQLYNAGVGLSYPFATAKRGAILNYF